MNRGTRFVQSTLQRKYVIIWTQSPGGPPCDSAGQTYRGALSRPHQDGNLPDTLPEIAQLSAFSVIYPCRSCEVTYSGFAHFPAIFLQNALHGTQTIKEGLIGKSKPWEQSHKSEHCREPEFEGAFSSDIFFPMNVHCSLKQKYHCGGLQWNSAFRCCLFFDRGRAKTRTQIQVA